MLKQLVLSFVFLLPVAGQEVAGSAEVVEFSEGKSSGRLMIAPSMAGVLPHVAIGGPWKTFLQVMNAEESASNQIRLNFFTSAGTPLVVGLSGNIANSGQYGSSWNITVVPRGILFLEVLPISGSVIQTGWIKLISDEQKGEMKMAASAIFRAVVPGRPDMEAVVPLEDNTMDRTLVAFDNTNGFTTSMALVNPWDYKSCDLIVDVISSDGTLLGTYRETLSPSHHIAFETNSRWPVSAGEKGTLRIRGATPGSIYSALAILFNPSGSITTAPVYQIY